MCFYICDNFPEEVDPNIDPKVYNPDCKDPKEVPKNFGNPPLGVCT